MTDFNEYPDKHPPRCAKEGCSAPLSSRDIACGYKFHTEDCYLNSMIDVLDSLFDDADDSGSNDSPVSGRKATNRGRR